MRQVVTSQSQVGKIKVYGNKARQEACALQL